MSKSPGKAAKWAARSERLAVALRENLKRRKAQARGRAADDAAPSEELPERPAKEQADDQER
jgi:hypothetical protein